MRVRPPVRRRQRYRYRRRRIFKHRQNTRTVLYSLMYAFYTPANLHPWGQQTSSSPARSVRMPGFFTLPQGRATASAARKCAQTGAHAHTRTLLMSVAKSPQIAVGKGINGIFETGAFPKFSNDTVPKLYLADGIYG